MTVRYAVLVCLLGSTVGMGTEFYSWHTMDTRLISSGRLEVTLHQRTRTRHELHYLDQVRFGPTARFTVSKRLTVLGGYYFQPQQIRRHEWAEGQRVFGGIEVPFAATRRLSLSTRLVAERHIGTGRPDYNRFRTSERLIFGRGRVRPFLQNEVLAVRRGFHSTRNSGGLLMRLNAELSLDVSYLYDVRRAFWGGDRQAIVTSMRWAPKFKLHSGP